MTQWRKGVSGNPGGRPREVGELRALARQRTQQALDTLTAVMADEKAPASARVAAAVAILDRGHGRPTQTTELTGADGGPIATVTDNRELARRIALLLTVTGRDRESRSQ